MNLNFVYTEPAARKRARKVPTYHDQWQRLYVSNQLEPLEDAGYVRGTATFTVVLPRHGVGEDEFQRFPVVSERVMLWHYADGRLMGNFFVHEVYLRRRENRLKKRSIGVRLSVLE